MPDPMFEGLYREADQLRWPTAAHIRHRGNRARQRRLVTVAAVAALLVLAGGTATAFAIGQPGPATAPPATAPPTEPPATPSPEPEPSGPPTPSPTGSPTESPSPPAEGPAELPAAAMLQLDDLPPANWAASDDTDGDWTFRFLASMCNNPLRTGYPTPLDTRERAYRERPLDQPGGGSVLENVYRYPAGDAAGFLDVVRRQVAECGGYRLSAGLSIEDEGFAGDESLLVRSDGEGGAMHRLALVRQGDLVAEIDPPDPADQAELVRLAERAADRLCVATPC